MVKVIKIENDRRWVKVAFMSEAPKVSDVMKIRLVRGKIDDRLFSNSNSTMNEADQDCKHLRKSGSLGTWRSRCDQMRYVDPYQWISYPIFYWFWSFFYLLESISSYLKKKCFTICLCIAVIDFKVDSFIFELIRKQM